MKVSLLIPLFASIILMSSCVSSGDSVNMIRYTLTDDVSSEASSSLNEVSVKLYGALNENAIVIQLSPVELRPASNHQWYGKLSGQLALVMQDVMLKEHLAHDVKTDIYVTKFYGSLSGEVTIDACFKISQGKNILRTQNLYFKAFQARTGYTALVERLKEGWIKLCQQAIDGVNFH